MPTLEELRARLRRGDLVDAPSPPVAPEEKHRWTYRHNAAKSVAALAFHNYHFTYEMDQSVILSDNPSLTLKWHTEQGDVLEAWTEDGVDKGGMAAVMSDLRDWESLSSSAKGSRASHWRTLLCSGTHLENNAAFKALLELLAHASMTYLAWVRESDRDDPVAFTKRYEIPAKRKRNA